MDRWSDFTLECRLCGSQWGSTKALAIRSGKLHMRSRHPKAKADWVKLVLA